MSEVFLSYSSADEKRATALARALEKSGVSVWWDRKIPPGRTFADVIQEALARADCVVLLWSRTSVESEWVHIEAGDARERRVLVPVLIEDVTDSIPLEFRRIEAADLIDWPRGQHEFKELVETIRSILARSKASAESARPKRRRRRLRTQLALIVVGVLAAAAAMYVWSLNRSATTWRRGLALQTKLVQALHGVEPLPAQLEKVQEIVVAAFPELAPEAERTKAFADGWGQAFVYQLDTTDASRWHIRSIGPNGRDESGGGDDVAIPDWPLTGGF